MSGGLNPDAPRYELYSGPSAVDFDREGYPDVLLCYHDSIFARFVFNQRNGTFVKPQWGAYYDNHGTAATPISPFTRNTHFSLSVGGNLGNNPRLPYMWEVDSATRDVINITARVACRASALAVAAPAFASLTSCAEAPLSRQTYPPEQVTKPLLRPPPIPRRRPHHPILSLTTRPNHTPGQSVPPLRRRMHLPPRTRTDARSLAEKAQPHDSDASAPVGNSDTVPSQPPQESVSNLSEIPKDPTPPSWPYQNNRLLRRTRTA